MSDEVKWPFYPHNKTPKLWARQSHITLAVVGIFSKFMAEWFNRTKTYNKKTLHDAMDRAHPTPLITVSNHHSCLDDPVIFGVMKWHHLAWESHKSRWTLAASDITFTREWHSAFFSRGRCVPIVRGAGVYQKAMDFVLEKLNAGEWVHVFPEGQVNMTHELVRLKWGVGRLIAECKNLPLVIPMYHLGMDSVLPNVPPYIPRVGKSVSMMIGDPMDFRDMLAELREMRKTPMEMRKAITDRIQEEFATLKVKAEELHFGHQGSVDR